MTHDQIASIIFDSIGEGVFTTDGDCRITSFNRAAEKISGFGREAAIGSFCFDIFRTELCSERCALRTTLENDEMQRIFGLLPDIAKSECSVLIQGPSGTGKELIAQALHDLSPRQHGPFVKINCGALPENLLESELFGYERGAFTDARRAKPGQFRLADSGTLLLDEIGEMPVPLQVKLFRVLSSGEFTPLGSVKV